MSQEPGHNRQSQPTVSADPPHDAQIKPRKRDRLRALPVLTFNPRSRSPSPIPPGPITNPQPTQLQGPTIDTSNAPETDNKAGAQRAGYQSLNPPESNLDPNNQPPTLDGNMDTNVKVVIQPPKPPDLGTHARASALWVDAYNKLSADDKTNLETLNSKLDQLRGLLDIANKVKQERTLDQWTIQWGNQRINVREKANYSQECT